MVFFGFFFVPLVFVVLVEYAVFFPLGLSLPFFSTPFKLILRLWTSLVKHLSGTRVFLGVFCSVGRVLCLPLNPALFFFFFLHQ